MKNDRKNRRFSVMKKATTLLIAAAMMTKTIPTMPLPTVAAVEIEQTSAPTSLAPKMHDALQILRYLVGLSNDLDYDKAAYDAARITGGLYPRMADALQILRYLVKLPNMIDGSWTPEDWDIDSDSDADSDSDSDSDSDDGFDEKSGDDYWYGPILNGDDDDWYWWDDGDSDCDSDDDDWDRWDDGDSDCDSDDDDWDWWDDGDSDCDSDDDWDDWDYEGMLSDAATRPDSVGTSPPTIWELDSAPPLAPLPTMPATSPMTGSDTPPLVPLPTDPTPPPTAPPIAPPTAPVTPPPSTTPTVQAGKLTARELRDHYNWNEWTKRLETSWAKLATRWDMNLINRTSVQVTDENGKPVRNAEVVLYSASNGALDVITPIWIARTDHLGIAYVFDGGDAQYNLSPDFIEVTSGESTTTVWLANDETVRDINGNILVVLETPYVAQQTLDLMVVLDTTGSMGSEIAYLQAELEDVIKKVRAEHGNIPVRLSINFYKDRGDVYVVQPNDFTDDVPAMIAKLMKERASGGGDWPEAVDEALMNAVFEHEWLDDSVKIMLVVLDAPPHDRPDVIENLGVAMRGAAAAGIRIVPVIAGGRGNSSYDTDLEFVMRNMVIATGGVYTYLTKHSGIGSGHSTPSVSKENKVEPLNTLLIRIIGEYLEVHETPLDGQSRY